MTSITGMEKSSISTGQAMKDSGSKAKKKVKVSSSGVTAEN